MNLTVSLDDDLVAAAQTCTGIEDHSALVTEALRTLVERESSRRLAKLGGTESDLKIAPRRRVGSD